MVAEGMEILEIKHSSESGVASQPEQSTSGYICEVGDSGPLGQTPGVVKWSRIEPLFSPRYSKDKASGKNSPAQAKRQVGAHS